MKITRKKKLQQDSKDTGKREKKRRESKEKGKSYQ